MRTTIDIDDRLLAAARRRAAENGTTLTAFVEHALAASLARLFARRGAGSERLAAARALRATLPKAAFRVKDIAGFKRQGRA
jgi:Arc/MetJ family transcription regulator